MSLNRNGNWLNLQLVVEVYETLTENYFAYLDFAKKKKIKFL